MSFPDAEDTLIDFLSDLGEGFTSTPADMETILQAGAYVLRIARAGGADDKGNDYPRMSVQTFALADYQNPRAAQAVAEQIRDRLNNDLPAMSKPGGVLLDSSVTESGPSSFPWPDPSIRCTQAVYRLTIRTI